MDTNILYLDFVPGERNQERKLAGIQRYATARGWEAVAVPECDSRPGGLRALFEKHRPVAGCVVEGSAGRRDLPPRLFGAIPVVYLDAPPPFPGQHSARVDADNAAIVRTALHELATGRPDAYAFVGYYFATPWERARERAFRAQAGAALRDALPRGDGPLRPRRNPVRPAGKVCTLLSQTDTSIGTIADFCGFGCYSALDALFRSRFGMSMKNWREKHTR